MSFAPHAHVHKGSLLVAVPNTESSLYSRSVILICEHNVTGSFGLIINKCLDMQLPEEILSLDRVQNGNISYRAGGPVRPNQMMLLHSDDSLTEQTIPICEGVFLGGDLDFLQRSITNTHGPAIRLCFGYCAWGPGALDKELSAEKWFTHPASDIHIFHYPPEQLWQMVLRQMGGKAASLSMMPEDLSLN